MPAQKPVKKGGYRPGAGRKGFLGGSVVKRIPKPLEGPVNDLVKQYILAGHLPSEALLPAIFPQHVPLPYFIEKVPAGFPSPAEGYIDKSIDLNEYLISNPVATFLIKAAGKSMVFGGINDGDLLVVNRAKAPKSEDVVLASVNGKFTVKKLVKKKGRWELHPENEGYPIITPGEDDQVFGVVEWSITKCSR